MKKYISLFCILSCGLLFAADTVTGIGASLASRGGKHLIRGVFENSPAAHSGQLNKGDEIIAVAQEDGEPVLVAGKSSGEVVNLIKGPVGSLVRLTIHPKDAPEGETRVVSLTRAEVSVGEPEGPAVGQMAPDSEIQVVATGETEKLSAHAGKIRVLDFWATWCGPCQPAMAKMQTYKAAHPEWGDKVMLISISTDRDLQTAKAHLEKKGWDKTYNTWSSEAPRSYGIRGIPHCYILDGEGKVVASGHPMGMDISAVINELLGIQSGHAEEQ